MPCPCPRDRRCAAGAAPGAAGEPPLRALMPEMPESRIPPVRPVGARQHGRNAPAGPEMPGCPAQSRRDVARHMSFLAEWQVTTKKRHTRVQNFQVFFLTQMSLHEHNHSQRWQSTKPLEGAELSPVCSPALNPGNAQYFHLLLTSWCLIPPPPWLVKWRALLPHRAPGSRVRRGFHVLPTASQSCKHVKLGYQSAYHLMAGVCQMSKLRGSTALPK